MFINREFGDDIERLLTQGGESSTPTNVANLEAIVSALNTTVTALVERIRKLEGGYQA